MEETEENSENGPIPKTDDISNSVGKSCALCGCSTPAVRCDRCSSQIFCLSCDDMYHRHPKRKLHLRKAVDSIWSTARSPRLRRRTDLPGDPSKIPIPPPRSKKRERHTVGGRLFLKPSHELGSFGHSKMDIRNIPKPSNDVFAGLKTPTSIEGTYENDGGFQTGNVENIIKSEEIYENENVPINQGENVDNSNPVSRSPWNLQRTNISSPIQVSIPSSSPDLISNGQPFGYPTKQSRSIADLTGAPPTGFGHHPYHLPHYPYMHPPVHPPYSHSMAHLNCAQCLSSSWSNLMSPHPSPYFHPMPWGSAQGSLARGHPLPNSNGQMKHSHGDLPSYPDPNFHYPYPGGPYYANGVPAVDPAFVRDLHQHSLDASAVKKSPSGSRHALSTEDMETAADTAPDVAMDTDERNPDTGSVNQDPDEDPPLPEKPTEPWSCLHCTFINPPGSYICQVCCKTSYGNKHSNTQKVRPTDIRNSESPAELVNLDAISPPSHFLKHKEAQKAEDSVGKDSLENEEISEEKLHENIPETPEPSVMLTTETQTSTSVKSTDVQTQNLICQTVASSTDSIFPKQEISVQTEDEPVVKNCSVATDPMISSQSLESLMSGVSAPPYHNRRAGWGRGASFSTQSLYERGRSRSPLPRSLSSHEAHSFGRDSSLPPEEIMHSWSQAWLMSDPMYYKPHNLPGIGQTLVKEDYFDGTWGSMDKLNRRVKNKQGNKGEEQRPRFHRSLDDLKAEKNQDLFHSRELQFLQTVKEAERCGFSLEDLHVAYLHCGKENPVFWLEDNWSSMIKNVIALAAKYGEDNEENDVGVISASEAKDALHIHRGDIWDAVTECIENRQRKILELTVRGNFTQKQIADVLKNNNGNVELAYADLLRASSKRHKFILSPGMSEDSEDLTLYNPAEESTTEHAVRASPLRTAKLDLLAETKADKKKSDFLTKLSSIRQAQSERRKAREEKEMIREGITQESQDPLATDIASPLLEEDKSLKIAPCPQISDTKPLPEEIEEDIVDAEMELDLHPKDAEEKKDGIDDSIPVNYDTNWVESQGEWIEEYSDEQWDEEGDGQWVSLQKKYEKMENELEEEAREMAALWEKEELEDEVFEEESKDILHQTIDSEAERLKAEQEEKFQQWVKINLEKSLSEPEDAEASELVISTDLVTDTVLSKSMEFDADLIRDSPLQHYPTEYDLSSKLEDPDWIDIEPRMDKKLAEAVSEIEEVSDVVKDHEPLMRESKDKDTNAYDQEYSEGEWEKIDYEAELLELEEEEVMSASKISREFSPEVSLSKLQFEEEERERAEFLKEELLAEMEIETETLPVVESTSLSPDVKESQLVLTSKEKSPDLTIKEKPSEVSQPRPPLRRKSKLSASAIEEVLKTLDDNVPPALPVKRNKSSETRDIYAVPDKHKTKGDAEDSAISLQKSPKIAKKLPTEEQSVDASLPLKPPRLNLSPTRKIDSNEGDSKKLSVTRSKDGSPATSVSNESDSNCFADSESDTEIKTIRQKYMHRKPAKYENEEDDMFEDTVPALKQEDPNKNVSKHLVDLQAGTLQSMLREEFDFGPELPTPIGSRGSRVTESEVASPKAFREGTARPLQLFKASPAASFEAEEKDVCATASEQDKVHQEQGTKADTSKPLLEQAVKPLVPEPEANLEKSVYSDAQLAPLEMTDTYYYNTATELNQVSQQVLQVSEASTKVSDIQYYNTVIPEPVTKSNEIQGAVFYQQSAESYPEQTNISLQQQSIPEEPVQMSKPDPPVAQDELAFIEMESASAADYFFGRYNEVTVTKPKKKTPVVKATKPAAVVGPKMSASQVSVISSATSPSQMTVSASPISFTAVDPPSSTTPEPVPETKPPPETKPVSIPKPPPEPTPEESLSFAEDYFFGSYNKVVIPRKVMIKPISVIPKPKSFDKPKAVEKRSLEVSSSDTIPDVQPELEIEPVFSDATQSTLSHSTPSGSLESIDESFYDACTFNGDEFILASGPPQPVENIQIDTSNDDRKIDSKSRSVRFEEPQPVIVPPPRKNRQKVESNRSSVSSYASAADDYSYHQYGGSQFVELDKKKLQPCSEDFKMKQGCDPSDFPSNSLSLPSEKQESGASSEISLCAKDSFNLLESYPKNDSFYDRTARKSSDDFEFLEIPTSPGHAVISEDSGIPEMSSASPEHTFTAEYIGQHYHELISSSLESRREIVEDRTSLNLSEYAAIGAADENIERAVYVSKNKELQEYSSENPEINSAFLAHRSGGDPTMYESLFQSDQKLSQDHEDADSVQIDNDFDDELHLVEETQNLINEFCDSNFLESFEITPSNEMKSLNAKNNQDLSYDSEQEWKMNEERNNSLNANFIDNKLYGTELNANQNIVDEDNSFIIDTCASVDPESGISDSTPEILSVALELSDINEANETAVECADIIIEETAGTSTSCEFSYEKDSESIIKPLSVLCQAAASTFESIALSLQNISFTSEEDISLEMLQIKEESASEPGYSMSDSLDALNEQSDDSLVTSTHSSISTQIAVSSDVKIQDLEEEISFDENTTEATGEDYLVVGDVIPMSAEDAEKDFYDAPKTELEHICSSKTETDLQSFDEKEAVEFEPMSLKIQGSDLYNEPVTEGEDEAYKEKIVAQNNDLSDSINTSLSECADLHLKTMESEKGDDFLEETSTELVVVEKEILLREKETMEEKDISRNQSSEAFVIEKDIIQYKSYEVDVTKHDIDVIHESSTSEDYTNLLEDSTCRTETAIEEDNILKEVSSESFASEEYCGSSEKSSGPSIVTESYSTSVEDNNSKIVSELDDKCYETSVNDDSNLEENNEESYGSLMSHFYDEWIENVKTTATLTTLQVDIRNLYTTYGYSGSSGGSSGNVSENEDVCESDLAKPSDPVVPPAKSDENITKTIEDVFSSDLDESDHLIEDVLENGYGQESSTIVMEPVLLLSVEDEKETSQPKITDDLTEKIYKESGKSIELEEAIEHFNQELSNQTVTQMSCTEAEISKVVTNNDLKDLHLKGQRISTSKSCQTDDSFEEDMFFDSFDDSFTDPSLLYFPLTKSINIEPVKIEIGVQCCLVDTEIVTASRDSSSLIETRKVCDDKVTIDISPAVEETPVEDWFGEPPEDIPGQAIDDLIPFTDSASKDSESASEATEDSDSDLFLEPHSSHEELTDGRRNSKARCQFLFAEVDSDTGFSSGSEYGIQVFKKSYTEDSSTKSEQKQTVRASSIMSETLESQNIELSSVEQIDQKTSVVSVGAHDAENSSKLSHSHEAHKYISSNQEIPIKSADKIMHADESYNQPEDYLERAVTPIAIERTPSIEEDLKFIEIKSDLEEQAIAITTYEETMKTPTVEFFYGPLPQAVSETLPDTNNELFVEALELLESGAQKTTLEADGISDEFENFADPISSYPEADDEMLNDSVSEYFAVPDAVSISSQSSQDKKGGASVDVITSAGSADMFNSVPTEQQREIAPSGISSVTDSAVISDHSLEISKVTEDPKNVEIFSDPISSLPEDDDEGLTHSVSEYFAIADTADVMALEPQSEKYDVSEKNVIKSLSSLCASSSSALTKIEESSRYTSTYPETVQSSCVPKTSDVSEDADNFSDPISSYTEDEEERLTESVSEYFALPDADTSHLEFPSKESSTPTNLKNDELSSDASLPTYVSDQSKHLNIVQKPGLKIVSTDITFEDQILTDASSILLSTNVDLEQTPSEAVKSVIIETSIKSVTDSDLVDQDLERDVDTSKTFSTEGKESFYSENQSDVSSVDLILGTPEKVFESVSSTISGRNSDQHNESDLQMVSKVPESDRVRMDSVNITVSKEITQEKNILDNVLTSVISSQRENLESCDALELDESVYSESISEYLPPCVSERSNSNIESFQEAVESMQVISESKDVQDKSFNETEQSQIAETSSANKEISSKIIDSFQTSDTSLPQQSSSETSNIETNLCVGSEPDHYSLETTSTASAVPLNILEKSNLIEETVSKEFFSSISESQNENILCKGDSVKMENDQYLTKGLESSEIKESDSFEDRKATDIPPVPSDIVRYLYYDDSITFEEDSCISEECNNLADSIQLSNTVEVNTFHSLHEDISGDVEPKICAEISVEKEISDLSGEKEHVQLESKDINQNLPSSKSDSTSADSSSAVQSAVTGVSSKEEFESMHSDLELVDQWFDLDVSKSNVTSQDEFESIQESEHLTETKSTTKEDSDFPIIPEMIVDKEVKVAHVESDEVTDISTHFTMTDDDSDKFSDIESDSSLNCLDEEGVFPLDMSFNENFACGISPNDAEAQVRESTDFRITSEGALSGEMSVENEENVIEKEENIVNQENQILVRDVEVITQDVNGNYNEVEKSNSLQRVENVLSHQNETCDQPKVDSSDQTADKTNEPCDLLKDAKSDDISTQSKDVIDETCSQLSGDGFISMEPIEAAFDQLNVDIPGKSKDLSDIFCDSHQVATPDETATYPEDMIGEIGNPSEEGASDKTSKQCEELENVAIDKGLTHFEVESIYKQDDQPEKEESSFKEQNSENSMASTVSFASLDASQTNNSYQISEAEDTDHWLDADNESITETEDLEFLLPDSKAIDRVPPSMQDNPPYSSVSIVSESSMKVQDTSDAIEGVPKVTKEELEPCVPKEIHSGESEVIIPVDTVSSPSILEEKIDVEYDTGNLDKSDRLVIATDNIAVECTVQDQEISISKPVMTVPDIYSQAMSLDIYETKETETDVFPKSVDIMPSDVDEAECSLNFGSSEGTLASEQEVCSQVTVDSSAEIKMNSIPEKKHSESDFVSISSAESLLVSKTDVISQNIVSSQTEELFKGVTVGTVYENVQAFDSKMERDTSEITLKSIEPLESYMRSSSDQESKELHATSEIGVQEQEMTLNFDQDISEVGESVSKDELTDVSYRSLSDDSDDWFEEESETSIEDTMNHFIPKQDDLVISVRKSSTEKLTEKVSSDELEDTSVGIKESLVTLQEQSREHLEENKGVTDNSASNVESKGLITLEKNLMCSEGEVISHSENKDEQVVNQDVTSKNDFTETQKISSCEQEDTSVTVKESQPMLQDQNREYVEGNAGLIDNSASNFVEPTEHLTKLENNLICDESKAICHLENTTEQVHENQDVTSTGTFIETNTSDNKFATADSTFQQQSGMDTHLCSEAESSNFYSLSDDIDDTLNISSDDDFTDVPSQITLNENSDMWSDAESISMEIDYLEQPLFLIEKDKTPTRDDFCDFKFSSDDIDNKITSESSTQNYGVECSVSTIDDAQSVPEMKHESVPEISILSKPDNVFSVENTTTISSDYENNNIDSTNRQLELLQMNTYDTQLEIKHESLSDKSIPCSPSKAENGFSLERTTNISSDYENNNMDSTDKQFELSQVNKIMEETENLQECKTSQQIDFSKVTAAVSGISESYISPSQKYGAEKEIEESVTSIPQFSSNDAIIEDDIVDTKPEDPTDESTASFNTITDECERWSDSEATSPLDDYMPSLESETVPLKEINLMSSITPSVDESKAEDKLLGMDNVEADSSKTRFVNLPGPKESIQNELHSIQCLNEQLPTEHVAAESSLGKIQSTGVIETALTEHQVESVNLEISDDKTTADNLSGVILITEGVSMTATDVSLKTTDIESEEKCEEAESSTEQQISCDMFEQAELSSKSVFDSISNDKNVEKFFDTEIENANEVDKNVDKIEISEQSTDSLIGKISIQDSISVQSTKVVSHSETRLSFDKVEKSEISSDSVFETISKDDYSEQVSDLETESYEELEKDYDREKKPELSRDSTADATPEPMLLVDGKKLSLSMADIIESSDLNPECDIAAESQFLEHFADIKSLSEQLALVETFPTFGSETAVPKMHDAAEASLSLEKTENSDYWLETETDYSVSEFEDEAVSLSSIEKPESSFTGAVEASPISEDKRNVFKTASQRSTDNTTDISVSFHTDTDYSDQVSDTCADISLQGATTENSDKWSDIEGDVAIEDIYGKRLSLEPDCESLNTALDIALQIEPGIKLVQDIDSTKKCLDFVQDLDLKIATDITEMNSEVLVSPKPSDVEEVKEQIHSSSSEVEPIPDKKLLPDVCDLPQKLPSFFPEREKKSLSECAVAGFTATGLSDEEFTNVTPLDVTTGDSDKWSDLSDDTSIEEFLDDSKSFSLKTDNRSLPHAVPAQSVDVTVSSKDISLDVDNTFDLRIVKKHPEQSLVSDSSIKIDQLPIQTDDKKNVSTDLSIQLQSKNEATAFSQIGSEDVKNVDEFINVSNVSSTSSVTNILPLQTVPASVLEVASESDIIEPQNLGVDLLAVDEPTFESDEIRTMLVSENLNESPYEEDVYENENLEDDMYLEDAEELDPNFEGHEIEYEDEEYPDVSEPFIINDDELVYPLQYEDWIEESFDLKEYGIEAVFSESETDVHELFMHAEDDEDIQRAIDFNINNFEEAMEGTTDEKTLNTDSFKTFSNNPSQSKTSEKEHDSWSTADADSIEDDLSEHDKVLSKIDELLAEDFAYGGDYYKDEDYNDDVEDYGREGFATPFSSEIVEKIEMQDEPMPDSTVVGIPYQEAWEGKDEALLEVKPEISNEDSMLHEESCKSKQLLETFESATFSVGKLSSELLMTDEMHENVPKSLMPETERLVESKIEGKQMQNVSQHLETTSKDHTASTIEFSKSEIQQKIDLDTDKPLQVSASEKIIIPEHLSEKTSTKTSTDQSSSFVNQKHKTLDYNVQVEGTIDNSTTDISKQVTIPAEKTVSELPTKLEEPISSKDEANEGSFGARRRQKPSLPATDDSSKSVEGTIAKSKWDASKEVTISAEKTTSELSTKPEEPTSSKAEANEGSFGARRRQKPSLPATDDSSKSVEGTIAKSKWDASKEVTISAEKTTSELSTKPEEPTSSKAEAKEGSFETCRQKPNLPANDDSSKSVESQVEGTIDKSKTDAFKEVTLSAEMTISGFSTKPEETKESTLSKSEAKEGSFEARRRRKPSLPAKDDFFKSVDESQVEGTIDKSKTDTFEEVTVSAEMTISELSSKPEETKESTLSKAEAKEGGFEVRRRKRPSLSTNDDSSKSIEESRFSTRRGKTEIDIPSEEHNQSLTLRVRKRSEPQALKTEESTLLQTSMTLEAVKTISDIPCDQKLELTLKEQVASSHETKVPSSEPQSISRNISSEESTKLDLKPDIPEKTKRGSLPKTKKVFESKDATSGVPSLPPKKSKRKSSSGSTSSYSSLSSSSESLSYESAPLKSESISTKETAVTSESIPDVPARKAKLKPSFSSSRKDSSDDGSSSDSISSRRSSGSLPKDEALSRKRASIDEQMIKLQNEGKCATKEKAFIAAKLIEMQFDEQDALLASRQCSSVYHAVKFLTQLCELCNCRFPINLMSSMVYCTHRACKECLKAHFITLIYDRSIFTLLCPICHKPDITDQNIQEYFNHLDMMFRNILDSSAYDLFQRKLRDEVLTKDPNFHWCSQCSSGFIASPRIKKLYCPDCSAITCSSCHQTWELEHEGVHCERFQQWKDMHTPEPPPAGSVKFLTDRGITCPSCGIVYAQASGGCMMYKCSHCSFECCGFCTKPYKRGKECGNKSCESLGSHAHHSLSCLFFLRDKDISELQLLLEEESVTYLTIPPKDQIVKSRCQVREQKHIHGNISEDRCGRDIVPYCAGLCRTHYYEYLAELLRKNQINPLPIMTTQDLQFMFRKCRVNVPEKVKGETNEEFYNRLTKIVSSTLT